MEDHFKFLFKSGTVLERVKRDCPSHVIIPGFVTVIWHGAFEGCTSLQSIEIPNSVTVIGSGAFEGCTSLQSIEIPDSVTEIGNWAFKGCTSLQSVEIPDSVMKIGEYAFRDCTSLVDIFVSKNHSYFSVVDGVLFNKDLSRLL